MKEDPCLGLAPRGGPGPGCDSPQDRIQDPSISWLQPFLHSLPPAPAAQAPPVPQPQAVSSQRCDVNGQGGVAWIHWGRERNPCRGKRGADIHLIRDLPVVNLSLALSPSLSLSFLLCNGVDPALLWDGPPAWGLVGRHPFLCLPPGLEDTEQLDSHTLVLGEGFEYKS